MLSAMNLKLLSKYKKVIGYKMPLANSFPVQVTMNVPKGGLANDTVFALLLIQYET